MRGRKRIKPCYRCGEKGARMAVINAMGSGTDMYFIKCSNPSCKRRTYAFLDIKDAIRDWNAEKVVEAIDGVV